MSLPTDGPATSAPLPVVGPASPAPDVTELALGAVAAHVEHGSGLLSSAELTAALATTVSGLQTQADAFELVDRLAQVAARSLALAARALGTEPTHLLGAAAAGAAGAAGVAGAVGAGGADRPGAPGPRHLR